MGLAYHEIGKQLMSCWSARGTSMALNTVMEVVSKGCGTLSMGLVRL